MTSEVPADTAVARWREQRRIKKLELQNQAGMYYLTSIPQRVVYL